MKKILGFIGLGLVLVTIITHNVWSQAAFGGRGGLPQTFTSIQRGQVTTASDKTVTNVFSPAFTSMPICVMSPADNGSFALTVTTITTTQFIIESSAASRVWNYIVVGER
jgi:hypothetical protein